MMMKKGIVDKAIVNNELWQTILHHRSTLTSMQGVGYTSDIRKRIQLLPPMQCREGWEKDYEEMSAAMIYGEHPTFETLMDSMRSLELLFKNQIGE
jgi:hypothetical protein